MKINWEHTRLIERYLDEDMTAEERISFEAEMSKDIQLRNEVEFHNTLRSNIDSFGERARLKRKMNTWHDEKKKSVISQRISRISWRTVGVAASVSLVLSAGVLTVYHFINQQQLENKMGNLVVTAIEKNTSANAAVNEAPAEENNDATLPSNVATSFAISKDGYMLTAFHVVEGKQQLRVEQFGANPVSYHARVVKVDQQLDIAIIKIDDSTFTGFKEIPFVFTRQPLELASRLYSVGYPLKKDLVFTEGSVSGLTGYKGDTVSCQVNLIANPGNSGSPVMNERGELVGVVLSKNVETEGETYITRTEFVRSFIEEMSRQKKYQSLKLNTRTPLKGQSLSGQVKNVSPYIFILRTK